jgi:hypothetical protein
VVNYKLKTAINNMSETDIADLVNPNRERQNNIKYCNQPSLSKVCIFK